MEEEEEEEEGEVAIVEEVGGTEEEEEGEEEVGDRDITVEVEPSSKSGVFPTAPRWCSSSASLTTMT